MTVKLITIILSLVLVGCVPSSNNNTPNNPPYPTNPTNPNPPAEELEVFTLAELATFDGKEGRKAYVAVDGMVYDVSDVPEWNGGHQGLTPGQDHSAAIEQSPHGKNVLRNLRVVGKLE
ncbi:MAG: hypothetical protein KGZ51_00025 [Erysipelothrix sp.]|jgi:predicted heme/steroid binding protein|nr:hypothetical protein [Erysipelothrix sp.]